jgi:hypothetical protein
MTDLETILSAEDEYRAKVAQQKQAADEARTELTSYKRSRLSQELAYTIPSLAPFAQVDAVPDIDKSAVVAIPVVIPEHRPLQLFATFDGLNWNLGKQEGGAVLVLRVGEKDFYGTNRMVEALVEAADKYEEWQLQEVNREVHAHRAEQARMAEAEKPATETPPPFAVSQAEKQIILGLRNMAAAIYIAGAGAKRELEE